MTIDKGLPPRTAWKDPDSWIECNDDGSVARLRPDKCSTIELPQDERGFVLGGKVVEFTLDLLFREDYDWFAEQDVLCNNHHLYYEEALYHSSKFNGDRLPQRFRDCPANRVFIVASFHNALQRLAIPPEVPDMEDMREFLETYEQANELYRRLGGAALNTYKHHQKVAQLVDMRKEQGLGTYDHEWVRRTFSRQHRAYRKAYDDAIEGVPHQRIAKPIDEVRRKLPESTQVQPRTVVKYMRPLIKTRKLSAVDYRNVFSPKLLETNNTGLDF